MSVSHKDLHVGLLPYQMECGAECPRWQDFLGEALDHDGESVLILQKWFGLMLTADLSQQKLMVIAGSKAGESVILRVMASLVDSNLIAYISPNDFRFSSFALSQLQCKTIALSPCIDRDDLDPAFIDRIASIVGGDLQTIRRKYQEPVYAELLRCRFTFFCESMPEFGGTGLEGRTLVTNLRRNFTGIEEERIFTDITSTEMPGVLNWAIQGLHLLDFDGSFVSSPAI